MSLTVARSKCVRNVLTHASFTKINLGFNFSSVRVSNIVKTVPKFIKKK